MRERLLITRKHMDDWRAEFRHVFASDSLYKKKLVVDLDGNYFVYNNKKLVHHSCNLNKALIQYNKI